MRDYSKEFADRVQYIRKLVADSGVDGIVFGNSGGKDSALVGILCKFACENTVGIMMPCASKRNFEQDMKDAKELAEHFGIESRVIDLTDVRQAEIDSHNDADERGRKQHRSAPEDDDAVCRCRVRIPPCRRNRKPQREVYGLLYKVGRRLVRL